MQRAGNFGESKDPLFPQNRVFALERWKPKAESLISVKQGHCLDHEQASQTPVWCLLIHRSMGIRKAASICLTLSFLFVSQFHLGLKTLSLQMTCQKPKYFKVEFQLE